MIKVIILIFFSIDLISSTITINVARDDNKTFSIIHIKSSNPIECYNRINRNFQDEIKCLFDRPIKRVLHTPENLFFKIKSDLNSILITSKYKTNLYPIPNNFITTDRIYTKKSQKYRHWVIIGYKELPSLYEVNEENELNFPVEYEKGLSPFIGALDLDEKPLENKKEALVMSRIRQSYKNKKYDMTISYCEKILSDENSLYYNDAALYKIRVLNKFMEDKENDIDLQSLIGLIEDWIEENPSESEIPELLSIKSNVYIKKGLYKKAYEVISVLKSEYKDNYFTYIAEINYADSLKDRLKLKNARKLYEEIFYSTKKINIASIVATKLTIMYLDKRERYKARDIYSKIIKANKNFINKNIKESYDIAKEFADNGDTNMSLDIAQIFDREKIDKSLDKEELEKNIAFWYENRDKDRSIDLYRKYLKKYPNGEYTAFVKRRLDALMINSISGDLSTKLSYYDSLMKKYPNSDIYKKALLKKVELLIDNKLYKEVLSLSSDLKRYNSENLLKEVAKKELKIVLGTNNCKEALALKNEYNISVQGVDDKRMFNCLFRYAKYHEANKICESHLAKKSINENLLWLYNKAKLLNAMGKYEEVIKASEDIKKMLRLTNNKKYEDILYMEANAYYELRDKYSLKFIDTVAQIERRFRDDIRNLDLYEKVIKFAKSRRDDLMIIKYAKKMISIQHRKNISLYTPIVEIEYVMALKNMKKYNQALKEDIKLLYKKLDDSQKANVLYIAGDLSLRLNKKSEAKEFFIKCGKIVNNSAWQKLCSDSLRIIE